MEQENFIHDILNSTNGITKVIPNDELLSKIEQRINEKSVVSMRTLWLVAASIVILIGVNIIVLTTKNTLLPQSAAAELKNSVHKSNQLY